MPETMPRSRGAASLALASALGDAWSEINTQLRAVLNQQRKRLNRSGFGRGLGGLLGALAINVALPGAGPFITGLAGGLGSRLGSEIGSKSAGKRKTVSKGDFFQETRKDLRSDISDANRQFTQGQNIGALFDAVSAGLSADTYKLGGEILRDPGKFSNFLKSNNMSLLDFAKKAGESPKETLLLLAMDSVEKARLERVSNAPSLLEVVSPRLSLPEVDNTPFSISQDLLPYLNNGGR